MVGQKSPAPLLYLEWLDDMVNKKYKYKTLVLRMSFSLFSKRYYEYILYNILRFQNSSKIGSDQLDLATNSKVLVKVVSVVHVRTQMHIS